MRTYFNDINVGRNIFMNSQLQRILFMSSDFSQNEIPDLNTLKPFEFEPKTNIGDTNSSQKQPSDVVCNKRCS